MGKIAIGFQTMIVSRLRLSFLAERRAPIDRGERDLSFPPGCGRIRLDFGRCIFTLEKEQKRRLEHRAPGPLGSMLFIMFADMWPCEMHRDQGGKYDAAWTEMRWDSVAHVAQDDPACGSGKRRIICGSKKLQTGDQRRGARLGGASGRGGRADGAADGAKTRDAARENRIHTTPLRSSAFRCTKSRKLPSNGPKAALC